MESLLRSLGIADDVLQHLDKVVLAFQRPYVLWIGLLLLIPIGVYVYRRQRDNLSTVPKRHRIALTVTRVFILTMLIVILAGPHLKLDERITKKPIIAVLVDVSRSMSLPSGPFASAEKESSIAGTLGLLDDEAKLSDENKAELQSLSRGELAGRLLQIGKEKVLDELGEDFEIRAYSLGDQTIPLETEMDVTNRDSSDATHLGDAIEKVIEEAAGQQIAGIWLLSDGQTTGGVSTITAARAAAEAEAPIFATPLGSLERIKDIAIVDVYTSGLVSLGDDVQVHATIQSQGFAGRSITVELRDGDEVLDTQPLKLRDGESQQVELSFEAKNAGPRALTISIPPQKEELEALQANNSDAAFVRVSKDKLKTIYLDGLPRWDFRFLKNAMRRDSGLQGRDGEISDVLVETEWRRLPEAQKQGRLPAGIDQWKEYHTIVLGDVSPALLTDGLRKTILDAVRNEGVGLIVAAGPQAMPHAFGEEFQELLPVKLTASDSSGKKAPVYKPFRLRVSPAGNAHETMRLFDDPARNADVWANMPSYYWCSDVQQPAAGASVLAYNGSLENRFGPVPLIAHHYAGEGRVLFVGTDSTWLWRQNVGDRYFYKFWGQAIRFVARKDEGDGRTTSIEIRPVRALPGENAEIELMAFDSEGSPIQTNEQTIQLQGPEDSQTVKLIADKNKPGRYVGQIRPTTSGKHTVEFRPPGAQPVRTTFQVLSPQEFRFPNLNRSSLAAMSNASAGVVVEPENVEKLSDFFSGESETQELHREASLWDNWLTLLLLILTYSFDVGLRRLTGLT